MIRSNVRRRLLAGAALTCAFPAVLAAQTAPEIARYTIQVMTQSFDGERESMRSQALAYARMRQGDESWIELNFGDGGTVTESAGGTTAATFRNLSGVEAGLRYNYATRQLSAGGTLSERFHNTFVRRHLGRGPALGQDAQWSVSLTPAQLGVVGSAKRPIAINLSREYFRHDGRDFVLIRYRVPAFTYDASGRAIVQWGEGAALTDPGFGTMYWNVALHRAVADEEGTSGRPYRHMKTLIALDDGGNPMIDPKAIPQVVALMDTFYGTSAQEVMGFVDGTAPDYTPLVMAGALDVMALSIAEDSPNQLGEVTSQIGLGNNGQTATTVVTVGNTALENTAALGAQAYANGTPGTTPYGPGLEQVAAELTHTVQQNGGAKGPGSATISSNGLVTPGSGTTRGQSGVTQGGATQGGATQSVSGALTTTGAIGNQVIVAIEEEQKRQQLARFDAMITAIERRNEEIARIEAGLYPAYEEASLAREAMLASQTDENRARLVEGAEELIEASGVAWRLAEAHRREAVTAYDAILAAGSSDQVIAAIAMMSEANRLVAEALRFSTFADKVAFVDNELETGEQVRLEEIPTTSSAVNANGSGSGGGEAAGGGTGAGGGGGGSGGGGSTVTIAQVLNGTVSASEYLQLGVELADKFNAISEGLNVVVAPTKSLSAQVQTLTTQIESIKAAIAAETPAFRPSTDYAALQKVYAAQKAEIAAIEATFEAAKNTPGAVIPPGMFQRYMTLGSQAMDSSTQLAQMLSSGEALVAMPTVRQMALAANLQAKAAELGRAEAALATVGRQASRLQKVIKGLSQTEFAALVKSFGSSSSARVLANVAHGLNAAAVYNAVTNTVAAANTNLGEGQTISTARNYGTVGSWSMLGLEVGALAGNAYSGNIAGFLSDATALTLGSVTDIIITMKGVQAANFRAVEAEIAVYETETRVRQQRIARFEQELRDLGQSIAEAEQELEDFDEEVEKRRRTSAELLAEKRRKREEAERAAKAAEIAAEEQAQREAERIAQAAAEAEARRTEPTAEEWEEFRENVAEAMRPDYPTVSAEERERISQEAAARREAQRQAEIAAQAEEAAKVAAEVAAAEAARRAHELEMQRIAEESVAKRKAEQLARQEWLEQARKRELEVTPFDSEPVVFTPPTFTMPVFTPPVFTPPVFVPPEFDPPEISPINTSTLGEAYPNTGYPMFGFPGMSGKVETSLERWAEWLATQNVRELERLALQAGYPNLASALADAENIIRMSQDAGYRQWAMQAPSCGGYAGCGPSYLERWAMKSSIVALGDILNASRGIFSTGGFSDIGITGNNLSYLLRDHGIQDGDIVQISIQQFGRVIYQGRLSLTIAGNTFNLPLRQGVASLSIFAENEGTASPNTAQINVQNVVRGEGIQTYNLRTGQTATLRIETNARAGGN